MVFCMDIPFFKMHGAGNDFIVVDDRGRAFPMADTAWIRRIAERRTGIGCEGILLIQPSETAAFRMRFINPDGGEVEMCGNGARCIARLAADIGAAPPNLSIETIAGRLEATVRGDRVRLRMTDPQDWRLERTLELDGRTWPYGFVNSGVPHVVCRVERVDAVDVARTGSAIRRHPDFQPAGANANFIEITGPSALRIRTFERGVESETLACGTGIVAAALVAARAGWVQPPVRVVPRSGDALTVAFAADGDTICNVILDGPAVHVFRGTVAYP